tara:strand:+ start:58 stop:825 length:768 start_codon:yes stop_codon:yes gene_type:complete
MRKRILLIGLIKKYIEKFLPVRYQLPLRYFYSQRTNKLDEEMVYVSNLLKEKRRFLDVGANIGIYSYHFKNSFENIDAFEPLTEISYRLKYFQNECVKVHNCALSNKKGEFQIYIPYLLGKAVASLASLEKRDGDYKERIVKVDKIDNFDFKDVDLIKIDVEGHEEYVIEGARNVIKKNMPILIVEIEQRHIKKPIEEVFQSILKLDYNGFFLQNGGLTSLRQFNYDSHQKLYLNNVTCKQYINNFIFIPYDKHL